MVEAAHCNGPDGAIITCSHFLKSSYPSLAQAVNRGTLVTFLLGCVLHLWKKTIEIFVEMILQHRVAEPAISLVMNILETLTLVMAGIAMLLFRIVALYQRSVRLSIKSRSRQLLPSLDQSRSRQL